MDLDLKDARVGCLGFRVLGLVLDLKVNPPRSNFVLVPRSPLILSFAIFHKRPFARCFGNGAGSF